MDAAPPVRARGGPAEASLHAAALGGAAAVVRDRGVVLDRGDAEAGGAQAVDGGLTSGAGALDAHLDLAHTDLAGLATGRLAGAGGGEGRALASALEAH